MSVVPVVQAQLVQPQQQQQQVVMMQQPQQIMMQPQVIQQQQFQPQQLQQQQIQMIQQPPQVMIMGGGQQTKIVQVQPQMGTQIMVIGGQQGVLNSVPLQQLPYYKPGSQLIEMYGGEMINNCDALLCLYSCFCTPCAEGEINAFNTSSMLAGKQQGNGCGCIMGCLSTSICSYCFSIIGLGLVGGMFRGSLERKLGRKHPQSARPNFCLGFLCHGLCWGFAGGQELKAIRGYNKLYPNEVGGPEQCDEMVR